MSAAVFRAARRAYGVLMPLDEVPAHLACGWRLVGDCEDWHGSNVVLLAPPRAAAFCEGDRIDAPRDR